MKLNLQSVDLADLARRVADLYQQVAEDKGIEIVVDMPDAITLRADNSRLPQVVANLVDNAVKYTYSGGRITLSAHANNGEVAFSVKDTGIGISAEELDRDMGTLVSRRQKPLRAWVGIRTCRGKGDRRVPSWTGYSSKHAKSRLDIHDLPSY